RGLAVALDQLRLALLAPLRRQDRVHFLVEVTELAGRLARGLEVRRDLDREELLLVAGAAGDDDGALVFLRLHVLARRRDLVLAADRIALDGQSIERLDLDLAGGG